MTLQQFLNSKNYDSEINQILLNIEYGSIKMYQKLNEETDSVLGSIGKKNIQNEEVQKLDLVANNIFISHFKKTKHIAQILSCAQYASSFSFLVKSRTRSNCVDLYVMSDISFHNNLKTPFVSLAFEPLIKA